MPRKAPLGMFAAVSLDDEFITVSVILPISTRVTQRFLKKKLAHRR